MKLVLKFVHGGGFGTMHIFDQVFDHTCCVRPRMFEKKQSVKVKEGRFQKNNQNGMKD